MWLLNSCSWEMKDFISYKQAPPYVILTHTWGDEEVTFRDWQSEPSKFVESKEGFNKIRLCCQQAAADGFEWVWVDTCCIDKTSSAEITEAINSMFQWYQNAAICYAYLNDVVDNIESNLAGCRWVTRGWTLQELIAPREVVFYSSGWHALGTRSKLSAHLAIVTGIDETFLAGKRLEYASIAQRMSWAAKRTTSRDEDMAYCLLGIFDVNMPLIYGEGWKAFRRLQEILIHEYPEDLSLFAWGKCTEELPNAIYDHEQIFGSKRLQFDPHLATENLFGLLAESPKNFKHSGCVVLPTDVARYFEFDFKYGDAPTTAASSISRLTGRTAQVKLPKFNIGLYLAFRVKRPLIARFLKSELIVLPCGRWDISRTKFQYIIVPIIEGRNKYSRTYEITFSNPFIPQKDLTARLIDKKQVYTISPVSLCPPQAGDLVIRRNITESSLRESLGTYGDITFLLIDGRIKIPSSRRGPLFSYSYNQGENWIFSMVFARIDDLGHSHDDPAQGAKCGQYRVALQNLRCFGKRNASRIQNEQDSHKTPPAAEEQRDQPGSNRFYGEIFYRDGTGGREIVHDMVIPRDEWRFLIYGVADVYVSLERIYFDDYDGDDDSDEYESHRFVDVLDLVVKKPEREQPRRRKQRESHAILGKPNLA